MSNRPVVGSIVRLIANTDTTRMTVVAIDDDVGGEPAYECKWLYDQRIVRSWHRLGELMMLVGKDRCVWVACAPRPMGILDEGRTHER